MLTLISYQSTNNGNSTKDISYMKENCRIVKVQRSFMCTCGCVCIHIDIHIYIFKGKSTPNLQIRINNRQSLSPLFSISICWVILTVDS